MNRPSILFTSLFALSLLAPVGCAVQDASDDASEETATDSEELSASAKKLVGKYYSHAPIFGGFGRLELKSNGKYTAQVDPAGTAVCITSPCLLPEIGTWKATKRPNGTFRLSIKTPGHAARVYEASKFDASIDWTTGITLTRNGKTETLNTLAANACIDNADCTAAEECGPKFCLMYCLVNDPSCCGPSTCQPKTPPPPPPASCCDPSSKPPPGIEGTWCCGDGSWQYDIGSGNEAMSCGSHGVSGTVCAGEQCGTSTCGAGTTCCNPLAGICTPPGMACAF